MSTTLVLRFPWGRYHANPWGRHVNEGAVELPPSPWRLLRALYATWCTRVPDLPESTVHGLLAELAAPPVFCVPRHTLGHTRHYYPDSQHRTAVASVDRTLDAFAVFGRDAAIAACWTATLADEHHEALEKLAVALPYFGRADSLCEASVENSWEPYDHEIWVPLDVADRVAHGQPVNTVLSPELPLDVHTLTARPVDVRRGNLLFPRGSRFIGYQCKATPPPVRPTEPSRGQPTAVRFDIVQTARPAATDAVIYTDCLRSTALSKLGKIRGERADTVLAGRSAAGKKYEQQHAHAHYLPLIEHGRLAGLLAWAPAGFAPDELRALHQVNRLRTFNDRRLEVRVSGQGDAPQLCPALSTETRNAGTAHVWESVTPFTPSRFDNGKDADAFLRAELARELGHREIDASLLSVERVPGDWAAFHRYRPSARLRGDRAQGQAHRTSTFLRLEFAEEVTGPLALGHLSHFGLGLFRPVR